MIVGVIKTKDLIFHPWGVIAIHGFLRYFHLLACAFSRRPYHFIDFMEIRTEKAAG